MQLARLDLGEVAVKRHATIDDHGCVLLELDTLAQTIDHGAEREVIARVAGEDLVGDGKTVTIEHEADDELLAVGAVITRMTEFGLGIVGARAARCGCSLSSTS